MLYLNMSRLSKTIFFQIRKYASKINDMEPAAGEFKDLKKLLKEEIKPFLLKSDEKFEPPFPRETDILIIGGGAMGMATAYWLKSFHPTGYSVTLVEQDPTYSKAATVLSVGSIRQQFGLPENIQMSLYSAEFFRNIKDLLSIDELEKPDIQFNHQGYLFLSTKKGADILEKNYNLQTKLGASVDLLTSMNLKKKFPWLNIDDLALGSFGLENEGWFDPWLYLAALKAKSASLGVRMIKGKVIGFSNKDEMSQIPSGALIKRHILDNAHVQTDEGKVHRLKFAVCVDCGGPWARDVARLAGVGTGEGPLQYDLPIEPRKRFVYMFHCRNGPGLDLPMLIDPSGVYVRREGLTGHYICGASPPPEMKEPNLDCEIDYDFFYSYIWPIIANRVPLFEDIKLERAWAGFYDYNYFDCNLILGNHPYHKNLYFAGGSSGHGIQHSPAIGRALLELIIKNEFKTINLSRMGFDRVMDNKPLFEINIV